MPMLATFSGCSRASATVSGSPGQPGAMGAYPASGTAARSTGSAGRHSQTRGRGRGNGYCAHRVTFQVVGIGGGGGAGMSHGLATTPGTVPRLVPSRPQKGGRRWASSPEASVGGRRDSEPAAAARPVPHQGFPGRYPQDRRLASRWTPGSSPITTEPGDTPSVELD